MLCPLSSPTICDSVLDAIGETPLLRLHRYLAPNTATLFAKLEGLNPGGSAKDRPARQMIEHALQTGRIDGATTIVESSSGNMGIGLAQACRYYGLRFICVVDPRAQPHSVKMMKALGAELEVVEKPHPQNGDFLSARLARVRQLVDELENAFWPNQYANEQNAVSHMEGTMREIDEALEGEYDYLFVATSSTGTIKGCQHYLDLHRHPARIVAVDATGSVLFGGSAGARLIPGLGAGCEPPLANGVQVDQVVRVTDFDCVVGCRRLVQREALLAGGSAGGVVEAIRRCSKELQGATCVAILHDIGSRYLDTVYDDQWVETKLGCSIDRVQAAAEDVPGGRERAVA